MVEQLCEGHHGGVLEVFPKAASDKVCVDPDHILSGQSGLLEELRVVGQNPDELSALLLELLPFAGNVPPQELVLEQLYLLLAPEYRVVDVPGQISDQVEPARLLPLLVLVQQVSQQDSILPLSRESLGEEGWVLHEHSTSDRTYFSMSLWKAFRVVSSRWTGTRTRMVLESIRAVATRPGYLSPFLVSNRANLRFFTCNPSRVSSSTYSCSSRGMSTIWAVGSVLRSSFSGWNTFPMI